MAKNCKNTGSIPRYALLLMLIAGGNAIAANAAAAENATTGQKVVQAEVLTAVVNAEAEARAARLAKIAATHKELRDRDCKDNNAFRDTADAYGKLIREVSGLTGSAAANELESIKASFAALRKNWSAFVFEQASNLFDAGKYEDAVKVCAELNTIDQEKNAETVVSFTEKCRKAELAAKFKNDINIRDNEFESNEKTIDRLMREAQTYYQNGKYKDVILALEKVYLIDPFNVRATTLLDKTYGKIYSMARARHRVTTQETMAQAEWNWVMPIKYDKSSTLMENVVVREKEVENPVEAKLQTIIFDKFDSPGMDILKILNYLASKSKGLDKDPVRPGVDIIPQFEKNELSNPKFQRIYMHFNKMPLGEILRYLCLNLGLKYRVDSYGNILVGTNVDDIVRESRKFSVRDELIADILSGSSSSAASSAESSPEGDMAMDPAMAEGAPQETAAAAPASSDTENKLKNYFSERGVGFPNGSSITYNSRYHQLIVRNTEENLLRLDELLSQIQAIQVPMVMTEVKFVEVQETHFNQLGFDWNFSISDAGRSNGLWNFSSGTNFVSQEEANSRPSAFIQNLNILPNFGDDFGGLKPSLNVTVHALSQNDNVEVLTTPRLISKSGQQANIEMVTETRYPDSWEAPELETESDNVSTISFPVPELQDDPEKVGVTMSVTPTVSYDNSITLELHPQIVTFLGSENSGYPVPVQEGYVKDGIYVPAQRNQVFNIWMPEFGKRSIDAKVKVDDGETIVLGGIINSTINRQEEKMPLLGSIPLLGRLFQNRSEDSSKTNLLIFVTARLINIDGRPVSKLENNGTPHFNF